MITLLVDERVVTLTGADVADDDLWLTARDAEAATGWVPKPEGLCRGPVCVPLPRGHETQFVRDARVNVAALWRHLGRPVARSAHGDVWVLGEGAPNRAAAPTSGEAPDFTLPDSTGRMHALSQYRGHKVLLVTWASW
jgi:hypothetical protein